MMRSASRKQMGDGRETLFWYDIWAQDDALRSIYPRLFRKSAAPLATVASMRSWNNQAWVWESPWSSPLRSRDRADLNSLLETQNQVTFTEGQKDQLIWSLHKSGNYSVNSFYLELYKNSRPILGEILQKMWRGLVPLRIEIFHWLVLLGKVNTKEKLAAHNIIPPRSSLSLMFK